MVAPNWNPASPGRVGNQHQDAGYGHHSVDSQSSVFRMSYEAQATRTIDAYDVYAGPGASAPVLDDRYNGLGRPVLLEAMNLGNEHFGTVTQHDFAVNGITGNPGMFNENLTTPLTTTRLTGTNDGFFIVASTLGASFTVNFASGAFPLDRHVIGMRINMRINLSTGLRRIDPGGVAQSPWFYTVPWWTQGAQPVTLDWPEVLVEGTDTAWSWWTPAKVREFDSTRGLRVTCAAGPGQWRMDRLYLSVYSIPERRRAVGVAVPSSLSWVRFPLQVPQATGAPPITSGDDLSVLVRQVQPGSVDSVEDATMPVRYLRGFQPTGGANEWERRSQASGDLLDGLPCVRTIDGTTVVEDSMPYSLQRGAPVYGANVLDQTLTMPGGPTVYGQAYVVAGWVPGGGRPVGPLRVEVLLDGVRVFSPVEVTAAEVAALPVRSSASNTDDLGVVYKTPQFRFPESLALAADDYVVRVSSPDSTIERPWYVGALIADDHTTDQTFGGATQFADGQWWRVDGTVEELDDPGVWTSDLQVQLVEVPAAVTGVATAVGSLTAHHLDMCDDSRCAGCADDTMPYIQVTWTAAPTGSPAPVGYQVDRQDDRAPDVWERVAAVSGRTEVVWNDHEARIGVPTRYRVRVVRADDVVGDWSVPVQEIIPVGQVALAFSSNAATGMGCVYPEVWDGDVQRSWTFRDADHVRLARIYGRNMPVAFRPLERQGEAFTRTVLLNALCTVSPPSLAIFDPLRSLALAPIPYVCVRDGEGNRWYASLVVPEGENLRANALGHELWAAEIGVGEIQALAAVHDTSVAQVEQAAAI